MSDFNSGGGDDSTSGDHLAFWGYHEHPHVHHTVRGRVRHSHVHAHRGEGTHGERDRDHGHLAQDLENLQPAPMRRPGRTVIKRGAAGAGGRDAAPLAAYYRGQGDEVLIAAGNDEEGIALMSEDDLMLTPYELAEAEAELAGLTGAYPTALEDDAIQGEIFRLSRMSDVDRLRSAGYRVMPVTVTELREQTPPSSVIGLTASDIPEAVYDSGEFNGVIPERATAWYRPGWDAAPPPGGAAGERALALSRVAQAVQRGGDGRWEDEAESVALAREYGEAFGLSASGTARHRATHLVLDNGVCVDCRAAERAASGAFADHENEAQRIVDMGQSAGILAVRNYHGKPGSGRMPTTGNQAHAEGLRGEWDSHPGESITDVEAILRRNGYAPAPARRTGTLPQAASWYGATTNSMGR